MTEAEARRIGTAANRLARLRYLLGEASDKLGSIVVGSGYAAKSIQLGSLDLAAILGLLIERDEVFLASFNVTVEKGMTIRGYTESGDFYEGTPEAWERYRAAINAGDYETVQRMEEGFYPDFKSTP